MKIAVCVKAVPDSATGRRIDPATGRLDRGGDLAVSDFDLHPVEEALRLRDAAGEGEVVVRLARPGRARRRAAQDARDGRRPLGARHATTRSRAPICSRRRTRSPARSSARAPTSSSSASSRPTATAPASGRPSPSCSGGR